MKIFPNNVKILQKQKENIGVSLYINAAFLSDYIGFKIVNTIYCLAILTNKESKKIQQKPKRFKKLINKIIGG